MNGRAAAISLVSVFISVGVACAAPPYATPADLYRYDRQAVDRDFDRQEDALRYSYKSARQMEEDAWRQARKAAPPQARKSINQQYAQRKKELARSYVAQRKSLDQLEDQTRDLVRQGYRSTLSYPAAPPVYLRPVYPAQPQLAPSPFEELPPPDLAPAPGGRDI